MTLRNLSCLWSVMFAFTCTVAGAWPPTFGPEFTVTRPEIIADQKLHHTGSLIPTRTPLSARYQELLKNKVMETCSGCQVSEIKNHYNLIDFRITHPQGWWFQISTDPGVIEVIAEPGTLAQWQQRSDEMQRLLFDGAKALGLMPNPYHGGGHIHIGLHSGFESNPQLLRNFIVDTVNHSYLFQSIFKSSESLLNAPVLTSLSDIQMISFREVIENFDQSSLKNVYRLSESLNKEVYFYTPMQINPPQKYQAINLTRINRKYRLHEQSVELRGIDAQPSMSDYLQTIGLLHARMDRLRLLKPNEGISINWPANKLSDNELIERFYSYVHEANLEWNQYHKMLPAKAQSQAFKDQRRHNKAPIIYPIETNEVTPLSRLGAFSNSCQILYNQVIRPF